MNAPASSAAPAPMISPHYALSPAEALAVEAQGGQLFDYPDKVRVIERSLRCFVFGLIGFVPLLGVALAFQAVRLHRSIRNETGEDWSAVPLGICWAIAFVFGCGFFALFQERGVVTVLVCFGLLTALVLHNQARRPGGIKWNPARRYLYWGLGLGMVGIGNSVATLTLILIALARSL
ncbi:MAG: hypothetical protein AB1813_12225 [Verrucomicrobiota bacterium]